MPTPNSNPSIVDYLNSTNQASDYSSRAGLAQRYGIANYTGTAQQNTQLLGILRGQGQTAPPPTTSPTPTPPPSGSSSGLGTPQLPGAITPANLTSTPSLNLPTPQTPTAHDALSGNTDTSLTSHQTAQSKLDALLAERTKTAEAQNTQGLTDTRKALDEILGVSSRSDVQATREKVSASETLNNDAFNALQASKRSQQKELLALEKQGGITTGQLQAQQAAVNRKYAYEQADLSIALDVSNRNYTAAQNTANNLTNSILEPLKIKYDYYSKFISSNADNLSKSETAQLTSIQSQIKQEHDDLQTQQKTLSDTKLQTMKSAQENGAGGEILTRIQQATTAEEAIMAAGQYLQKPEDLETQIVEIGGRKVLYNTQTGEKIKDLGVADGKGVDVSLSDDKKRVLLGANLTLSEVISVESDIKQFGISKVLEGITDPVQKKAIQDIYGGEEGTRLNRANVAQLFGMQDDEAKTGFLGFFGRGKTNKEKLDELMASIKKYQDVGYSDEDILKLMK